MNHVIPRGAVGAGHVIDLCHEKPDPTIVFARCEASFFWHLQQCMTVAYGDVSGICQRACIYRRAGIVIDVVHLHFKIFRVVVEFSNLGFFL